MCNLPESAILYLSDARGIYIPRDFFASTREDAIIWNCDNETKAWILKSCNDPENESYWDAWNDAECYGMVQVKDTDGTVYSLYQDGDLWLIPEGAEWEDD